MAFERIQQQTHIIEDTKIFVSYDRFTTKFQIKTATDLIYSAYLLFLPIRNTKISINSQPLNLKIFWLILWQAKLFNNKKVVIKELLYRRRKKSIGLLIYFMLASAVKIGIGVFA
jgi:hypothetical protein